MQILLIFDDFLQWIEEKFDKKHPINGIFINSRTEILYVYRQTEKILTQNEGKCQIINKRFKNV